MNEVQEVDLQTQVAELRKRVESLLDDHQDFRKVHVSRRGAEGGRGERGETGATGPSANPQEVAKIAAEAAAETVKKAFRYETQSAKFETLIKEFESEIAALRAALKFAIIEELQLSGFVDSEGRAVPGPAGADSQVPGPRGEKGDKGDTGPAGKDGVDGRDGQDGKSIVGPQGPAGKDSTIQGPRGERGESIIGPEGLQGLPGSGLSKTEVVELVRDLKRRGSI